MAPDQTTPIKCKHCSRHFATTSVESGLVPMMPQAQACASCEPFVELYEALQTADQEHTALLDRGLKHHGRNLAHSKLRNARVALENFLISIEAPDEASFDVAQAEFANRADPMQLEHTGNSAEAPELVEEQRSPIRISPPDEPSLLTTGSPTPRHRLPPRDVGPAYIERKRIKFTESVEERPEYRGTGEYYRNGKAYVPGRYVPSEGFEYLDTSGSTVSFAKFTGQKKVGNKFVDMPARENVLEGTDERPVAAGKGKKQRHDQEEMEAGVEGSKVEPEKNESQMSSRELRFVRRSRSSTSTSTAPAPATPAARKTRSKRIVQQDGAGDEVHQEHHGKPSLIVSLKVHYLAGNGASKSAKGQVDVSGEEGDHTILRRVGHNEAMLETFDKNTPSYQDPQTLAAADSANINQEVGNTARELGDLQQAAITPTYFPTTSTAVHGFFEVPRKWDGIPQDSLAQAEAAGEVMEEPSIFFDALDGTEEVASMETPHPSHTREQDQQSHLVFDAATYGEVAHETDKTVTLYSSTVDFSLVEDKQEVSDISNYEDAL